MFLSFLFIRNSVCLFFLNFHTVAPILNGFGMMVGDLLVGVLDMCRYAWVNSKPDYFPLYFHCKKSTGIVTAMGAKDPGENPTICTVPMTEGKIQTVFSYF
jgi:hypothetical protein